MFPWASILRNPRGPEGPQVFLEDGMKETSRLRSPAASFQPFHLGLKVRLPSAKGDDPEAPPALDKDVVAPVGEGLGVDEPGLGPHRGDDGLFPDLLSLEDLHHPEGPPIVEASPHEDPVAILEDVQGQQASRHEDGVQREERKDLGDSHGFTRVAMLKVVSALT
jgi:hypothetical protein